MLKNEDIICISWLVWNSIPLVMHQMMTRLARNNRVLFVNPPEAYSNLIVDPSLWKNHWEKTLAWLRGIRREDQNLFVYYPPPLILQYGHLRLVDRLNQTFTAYAIGRVAKQLGFKTPVLWIYHPYAIFPDGQFHEKLVCYDCNDDVAFFFCQIFGYKRKRLAMMEENLAKKADIVFATSKNLFHLRCSQNPHTHYLPSGVDLENFRKALSPALHPAPDILDIPKPIIGFIGGMANPKMNWEWIKKASDTRADWSFVFIGPCADKPPHYITEKKNIHFLGAKPADRLPCYLKAFDVCLIPYRGDDFLKNCSPTKSFEYLAAGKPVVSSYIPELEEYRHVIKLSKNENEFIANIERAIEDGKNEAFVKNCIYLAEGKTWDARVEEASYLIGKLL
ncbi:MAG: glycosyltransferase [Candidatus Brocadia sp.]|jgi:glycosyltransferase involved in cell wall biosynthesis